MMDNKTIKAVSKYFSYLLRHQPDAIGLQLDKSGWASIDELIEKTTDFVLTRDLVDVVVETNDKQRFSISDDGLLIRANQGHSIGVDLDLMPMVPPEYLLHGTAERFVPAIREFGLKKMQRHHVHLSASAAVARNVGSRYGKPVLLEVKAKAMHDEGFVFFKTANNVWLVDNVPIHYINEI